MASTGVTFGMAVVGSPGAGKTTFCAGMQQFMRALGRRVAVFNLDPANETCPYECAADISDLVSLDSVARELELGPNGSLVFAMEYLEKNIDWLEDHIERNADAYILLDFPGQIELFTHHEAVRTILQRFEKFNVRLTAVNLIDSVCCRDAGTFISSLVVSLSAMIQLELPHVNVLSKIDQVIGDGDLPYSLEMYTDAENLQYLLEDLEADKFYSKFHSLNTALTQLVEDYALVSFVPLAIEDKPCAARVLRTIDRANGYFGDDLTRTGLLADEDNSWHYERVAELRDRLTVVREKRDGELFDSLGQSDADALLEPDAWE